MRKLLLLSSLALSKPFNYLYFGGDYDNTRHSPKYTHYVLNASQINADVAKRDTMDFWRDDSLGTMSTKEYVKFGYDRGHMVPAEDMDYSVLAMFQTFSMANISPQVKELNRGPWRILEKNLRDSAVKYGSISIWTGPLYRGQPIIKRGMQIPSDFFKVFCTKKKCTGFVYPNSPEIQKLPQDSFLVNIKLISKETGLKFK